MIFDRLFKKPYESSDASKRQASVAALQPSKDADKRALHELAFNDEDADVSLAALARLNSFPLWLKAYDTHYHQKVKAQAKEMVMTLIEDEQAVSDSLFVDVITKGKHVPIVRELIFASKRLQYNAVLCAEALLEYGQENDIRRFYQELATDAQKRLFIEHTDDEKQLKRFKKYDNSVDIQSALTEKLNLIEQAASMPPKIIAAGKLINAKLLALVERFDYAYINQQKQSLVEEFEALKAQFHYLSEDDGSLITQKYLAVKEKVDKRLAHLEPDYLKQVHLDGVSDVIDDIEKRAHSMAQQVDLLADSGDDAQLNSQIELLDNAIGDLNLEVTEIDSAHISRAHQVQITHIQNKLHEKAAQLKALPTFIANNALAEQIIAKAQALLMPQDDKNTADGQPIDDFSSLKKAFSTLQKQGISAGRSQQFKALETQFTQQKKALIEQARRQEKRCLAKLAVCQKMIEQGKFKSAIGVFRTAQDMFNEIDKPSISINKRMSDIREKVAELQDWQSYIAGPRKPELIGMAEALIANTNIDIGQRAALVKQYRQQYLSLGKLHTEEDDAYNTQFDEAIEKAFAPCREFFAQQDKVRDENLRKGQQVVDALKALDNLDDPIVLNKQIQSLSTQYRSLKAFDRDAKNKLHKAYLSALKPLQQKVDAFYEDNARQKQNLVKRATALLDNENSVEASEQAKMLQQSWKQIGFAGKKQDSVLWQAFREANDKVFARLNAQRDAQKQASHEQVQHLESAIKSILTKVSDAQNMGEMAALDGDFDTVKNAMQAVDKASQRALTKRFSSAQAIYDKKLKHFEQAKEQSKYEDVFNVLGEYQQTIPHESVEALSAPFKQAFQQAYRSHPVLQSFTREQTALAADVLFAQNALFAESALKKEVQLALMAAKLEGQSMPSKDDMLAHWIAQGSLSDDDVKQLAIFKTLYMKG
ncbi:DUF349 domain-containing protein [Glaciecola sp. XM2]|uniref:DUF349 domain-containing protein n=1 Tax=Glaciecola sp. XM2 TaxID=1914931 RepID=UPI001BDDF14E|nr:DUF349 domain-containing protein [Glaciecola sp. XM2]MBT1449397.1 DUF349 domain-containing protein [Glaciecola sp. XM2]